jgi:plastocyanin
MTKKLYDLFFLCSIAILLLVACGTDSSASNASGNRVHMSDTSFEQSSITIKKGESITLTADTAMVHPVTNGTWNDGVPEASKEAGAPVVNVLVMSNSSETIGPFTNTGTFKLYCTVHLNMNLTVVVQ